MLIFWQGVQYHIKYVYIKFQQYNETMSPFST